MNSATGLVQLSGIRPHPAQADIQVTQTWAFGCRAWIAFRYDMPEKSRRTAFGLGSVQSWDLLDTLMDLPVGLSVPTAMLTRLEHRRVIRAPVGVARFSDGQVIRDLVPAVTPLLAIISARDWASGLARASRFASYCRRMVIGPGPSVDSEILRVADRMGIGLAVRNGSGDAEIILEPEIVDDWQPTTAWWHFCEVIYGHACDANGWHSQAAETDASADQGGSVAQRRSDA